jgi:glutathione S-transferase
MLRLYTFNISHFSEKARWALDFEGIPYEEKVLVPGPHQWVTRRLGRKSHVPLLVHDGRVIQGSSAILDHIASMGGKRLLPRDAAAHAQALAIEAEADVAFGLGVQRILYASLLGQRQIVIRLWSEGGPAWAPLFYALAYGGVAKVVQRMYKTGDSAAVSEARSRLLSTTDKLDATLTRQSYLGGTAPDRSDIAVAALFAPLCAPPEHRVRWPSIPADLERFVDELRERPTFRHVLRMYRDHRKPT